MPRLLAGLFGLICLQSLPAAAQQTDQPKATAEDEVLVLSAFEVRSSMDSGYRVKNSVATTGIAQELINTPLPITVVTGEFLHDTGGTGFIGALHYVSGISLDPNVENGNNAPGFGRGNSQPNLTKFRGQSYAGTYRNGGSFSLGFDTENIDRIEVAKGPMAVFVGGATLGGEVNLVTLKPLFSPKNELTFRVGMHDSFKFAVDSTGPINAAKTLAYRLIVEAEDKNTWREYSHSQKIFVNPQLTWRPWEKLTTRVEYIYRKSSGNLVSRHMPDTGNYQQGFDSPTPELLALGRRRTTGPGAGLPFTVDEYRARIGQAFGTWRQDWFDAYGVWVAMGGANTMTARQGGDLIDGPAPSGRRYNWFGPNAHFEEPTTFLEIDTTLVATDWLQSHLVLDYSRQKPVHSYYSFGYRMFASGNTPINSPSGTRFDDKAYAARLETVLEKKIGFTKNSLLLGVTGSRAERYTEDAVYDYTKAVSVPGSPYVFGTPATLVGRDVYTYFDPRAHEYPDTRLITQWPSEVRPAGQLAYVYTKSLPRAGYATGSTSLWDDRVILTGGFRRSSNYGVTASLDPGYNLIYSGGIPVSSSPPRIETDSYMYGAVVRLVEGVNLYGSINRGESSRVGSLVNRVSFGISPPDIVTPAEQAANPVPNELGNGREIGLKFDLIKHTLTGTVGYFELVRGNVLVPDTERTGHDTRNVGTEADLNPATADPSVRVRVQWNRAIDGDTTKGFETDLVWTPLPNYSVVLGASHLTTNKQTVAKPPTPDRAQLLSYEILNGRPLDHAPDTMIRLFQRYAFREGSARGFSIGAGVRYQTDFMPSATNAAYWIVYPGYTLVDLNVGYETKIRGLPVSFQITVDNLANSTYIEGNGIFGAPREISLTTRLKF